MTKSQKKQWEKFMESWKKMGAPGRPNREVCLILFRHIKDHLSKLKGETKIVILGCTPEYRDLAYLCTKLFNSKVICVDQSDYIYKAMSQLVSFPNKNEEFIRADWAKMPIKSNSVDVIMGDSSISNLPKNKWDKFFSEVRRIMKKNAIFIPRNDTIPKKCPSRIDVGEEFRKQAKRVLSGEKTIIEACGYVGDFMLRVSAFNNNYVASLRHFSRQFKEDYGKLKNKKDTVSKTALAIMDVCKETYLSSADKEWTIMHPKLFEKELKKYFVIKRKIVPKHGLGSSFKIYLMRKR